MRACILRTPAWTRCQGWAAVLPLVVEGWARHCHLHHDNPPGGGDCFRHPVVSSLRSYGSSSTSLSSAFPRAAVAATIQWTAPLTVDDKHIPESSCTHYYLLVQRRNPPDAGAWSLPGGKIEWGEATLDAAQREIQEETQLLSSATVRGINWYMQPFMTSDAIVRNENDGIDNNDDAGNNNNNSSSNNNSGYAFHYVIAQCFGKVVVESAPPSKKDEVADVSSPPATIPSDDALDAQWFTLGDIQDMHRTQLLHRDRSERPWLLSPGVLEVVERAEALDQTGLLPVGSTMNVQI